MTVTDWMRAAVFFIVTLVLWACVVSPFTLNVTLLLFVAAFAGGIVFYLYGGRWVGPRRRTTEG